MQNDHAEKLTDLMTAVKNLLLNICDRGEVYDDDDALPSHEFSLLYAAYAAMGGNFDQSATCGPNPDWPDWEHRLAAECQITLTEEH
jgi:hypothetical protein